MRRIRRSRNSIHIDIAVEDFPSIDNSCIDGWYPFGYFYIRSRPGIVGAAATSTAMEKMIGLLEREGFVIVKPSPADGRSRVIEVTG